MINDDIAKDVRIPGTDIAYKKLRESFKEAPSLKIFDKLTSAKTYKYLGDDYELALWRDIYKMHYMREDYWELYPWKYEKRETA